MKRRRLLPIRAKLTLWYLLSNFGAMVLFGVISYGVLHYALFQEKKTHLVGREQRLIRLLEENRAQHPTSPLEDVLNNYALITHEGNMFQLRRADDSLMFPIGAMSVDQAFANPSSCGQRRFQLMQIDGTLAMVMCHDIKVTGMSVKLFQGGSLDEELDILRVYRNALLYLLPGLLILSSLSGYFLSRRALEPVDKLTKAALSIGIGNLSARVPVPFAKDEVRQLAEAWNQLLERLEAAVARLSQFSADVSHDLRTSITIILATAQLALNRNRSGLEDRDDLNRIVTECCTAAMLLDTHLSLVQSKNFVNQVSFQRIDLSLLVLNGCRRIEDVAESKGILLDWDLPEAPVYIEGDELLISRLLGILLDNAIKYTPEHGEVRAEVFTGDNHEAGITVRDTGIGITPEAQEKIFDRFYQVDLRERPTQAGHGLGLSIARWIADAHRARITVVSIPLQGSAFTIFFPRTEDKHSAQTLQTSA
jgi:two-component system heavy metal sensor histidine kinase CusS